MDATIKVGAGGTAADPALTTINKLADHLRGDTDFMQVAELCAGRSDFDVNALVMQSGQWRGCTAAAGAALAEARSAQTR